MLINAVLTAPLSASNCALRASKSVRRRRLAFIRHAGCGAGHRHHESGDARLGERADSAGQRVRVGEWEEEE
ncbi:hypothetical protein ACPV3A_03755 [Paenibacillus sp. Dod16]|uniref:hypothetical protein n=1 Tax=Paenibacillus sp. Dod16 TaxID=3416392 RepID=UPI003CEE1946